MIEIEHRKLKALMPRMQAMARGALRTNATTQINVLFSFRVTALTISWTRLFTPRPLCTVLGGDGGKIGFRFH